LDAKEKPEPAAAEILAIRLRAHRRHGREENTRMGQSDIAS